MVIIFRAETQSETCRHSLWTEDQFLKSGTGLFAKTRYKRYKLKTIHYFSPLETRLWKLLYDPSRLIIKQPS